jgi:hypothetical protein
VTKRKAEAKEILESRKRDVLSFERVLRVAQYGIDDVLGSWLAWQADAVE